MADILSPTPSMDEGGLTCFKEALARSRCYLEYGCGGSTVYACNVAQVKVVIAADSDKRWLEKTKASFNSANTKLLLGHCDIGEVGDWGVPKSTDQVHNFWKYMATPWQIAKQYNHVPDTVLIDGRFRIASFLFSLLSARVGTTILFDDYMDRPQYFVVEEFCKLKETRGRMGVFTTSNQYSVTAICEKIAQYSILCN